MAMEVGCGIRVWGTCGPRAITGAGRRSAAALGLIGMGSAGAGYPAMAAAIVAGDLGAVTAMVIAGAVEEAMSST